MDPSTVVVLGIFAGVSILYFALPRRPAGGYLFNDDHENYHGTASWKYQVSMHSALRPGGAADWRNDLIFGGDSVNGYDPAPVYGNRTERFVY